MIGCRGVRSEWRPEVALEQRQAVDYESTLDIAACFCAKSSIKNRAPSIEKFVECLQAALSDSGRHVVNWRCVKRGAASFAMVRGGYVVVLWVEQCMEAHLTQIRRTGRSYTAPAMNSRPCTLYVRTASCGLEAAPFVRRSQSTLGSCCFAGTAFRVWSGCEL